MLASQMGEEAGKQVAAWELVSVRKRAACVVYRMKAPSERAGEKVAECEGEQPGRPGTKSMR
eukprot:2898609-Pleurochrysis_carterae.AAC.2